MFLEIQHTIRVAKTKNMGNNKIFTRQIFIGFVSIFVGFVLPVLVFSLVINLVGPRSSPGRYENVGLFLILGPYYLLPFPFVIPTVSSFLLYRLLARRYAGDSVRKVSDTPEDEINTTMPAIKDRLLYSGKALCVSLIFKIPAWAIVYGTGDSYSQNPIFTAIYLLLSLIGFVGMLGGTVALVAVVLATFNIKDTKRFMNISFFTLVLLWYLALTLVPTVFMVFLQSTLLQFQGIID